MSKITKTEFIQFLNLNYPKIYKNLFLGSQIQDKNIISLDKLPKGLLSHRLNNKIDLWVDRWFSSDNIEIQDCIDNLNNEEDEELKDFQDYFSKSTLISNFTPKCFIAGSETSFEIYSIHNDLKSDCDSKVLDSTTKNKVVKYFNLSNNGTKYIN